MTLRMAVGMLALSILAGCFEDTGEVESEGATGTTVAAGTSTDDDGGTTDGDDTTASGGSTAATDSTTSSVDTGTSADTTDGSGNAECNDCFTGRCDDEGRCERIVFVTAEAFGHNLGAVAGAHDRCGIEAADAELEGTFRALLAVNMDAATAFESLELDAAPNAIFVLNDDAHSVVTEDPQTFRVDVEPQADLIRPIDRDARGNPVEGSSTACADVDRVWTGLTQDMTMSVAVGAGSCGSWDGGGANGGTGRSSRVSLGWAASTNCPCVGMVSMRPTRAHLYCFEVPDG